MRTVPSEMAGAPQVIGLEQALHFFWEQRIQHFFLRWPDFVRFWNVYYWVAHGSNTIGALLALFFIRPAIYQVRVHTGSNGLHLQQRLWSLSGPHWGHVAGAVKSLEPGRHLPGWSSPDTLLMFLPGTSSLSKCTHA